MAQNTDAVQKMAEGIVGWAVGPGILYDGQAADVWLRNLRQCCEYAAKWYINDFVVDVTAAMTATGVEFVAGPAYVVGVLGWSKKTAAVAIDGFNVSTPTPGTTTSLNTYFKLYLPLAAATTPTIMGATFNPFLFFPTKYDVTADLASDDATGVSAGEAKIWSFRLNK